MMRNKGFTLIELLVVVAIISILAGIVVPRVQNWIARARMARAVSEVRNADLALQKMLIDAERKHFGHFFVGGSGALVQATKDAVAANRAAEDVYRIVFYELLRRGKAADFSPYGGLEPEPWGLRLQESVRKKLGTSYMDLGKDPWGENAYKFWAGPANVQHARNMGEIACLYRSYRGANYYYTLAAKADLDNQVRGNPSPDDLPGFPAPIDQSVYIWSVGADLTDNQYKPGGDPEMGNGGDDISNWDNEAGWSQHESYQ